MRDSNPRLTPCKGATLPTELIAREAVILLAGGAASPSHQGRQARTHRQQGHRLRHRGVQGVERPLRHIPPHQLPSDIVELEVNPTVNAALPGLCRRLAEGIKVPRGRDVFALGVKADVVCSEESRQGRGRRAAKSGVPTHIAGVVRRWDERTPIGVAIGGHVAVQVALMDGGDGPPALVGVLGVPGAHAGIRQREVEEQEHAGVVL